MDTSWSGTRADWLTLADRLVAPAAARIDGGVIRIPGSASKHGERSDGMEAFARTFLLHALRIAGDPTSADDSVTGAYLDGISAAMAGSPGERAWLEPAPKGHATVEATSIALGLRVSRRHTWDLLDPTTQDRLAAWLAGSARVETPDNNWRLFPPTTAGFLESVGRGDLVTDVPSMAETWNHLMTYPHGAGWISDGTRGTYDYYNSWALLFYPAIGAWLDRDATLAEQVAPVLRAHVNDLARLVASDGAPVLFGRSLTYRFASMGAVGAGAILDCLPLDHGAARALASRTVSWFLKHGLTDGDGLVRVGWRGQGASTGQDYSGPGASYWLAKAFVPMLLPATHRFWTAPEGPAPARECRSLDAPGLLVLPSAGGEVIRLFNHGSTSRIETAMGGAVDDPWYARLGYSSGSAPCDGLKARSDTLAFDVAGALSSLGPIEPLGGGVRWRASRAPHRLPLGAVPIDDAARARKASVELIRQKVHALTYGAGDWALQVAMVPQGPHLRGTARWGGAALAADPARGWVAADRRAAAVECEGRCSVLVPLVGFEDVGIDEAGHTFLGAPARLPYAETTTVAAEGDRRWFAVATFVGPLPALGIEHAVRAAPRVLATTAKEMVVALADGGQVTVRFDQRLVADTSPTVRSSRAHDDS